eukprot:3991581-Prymnesium_polylepis.1
MSLHERASGTLNNWPKTFGLRTGPLARSRLVGIPRTSDVTFATDPLRYVGIFLGSDSDVAKRVWAAA